MRRKRSRRARKYVVAAVAALAIAAGAFLVVRMGVSRIAGFFGRGSDSVARLGPGTELKKTVVVIGAESTEDKKLAAGVVLVQVDGVKREINAISIEPNTFVEVPGQGFARIAEALQAGPDTVVVAVSNLFGISAKDYIVLPRSDFKALLERQDFKALMSKAIASNISKPGKDRFGELAGEVSRENAAIVPLPVEPLSIGAETYYQPKRADIDKLVAGWWQVEKRKEKRRLRVMVLNGAGIAGVAGDAASKLINRGYHVVDSKNADSFNYAKTLILLYHAEKADGEAIQKILGVGQLMKKDLPQDIADVSVVIGKDYVLKQKGGKPAGG
jgi:hypothetical protein